MELTALSIPDSKIKQLNKASIHAVEDLLTFYPRKYRNRSAITGILPPDQESILLICAQQISYHGAGRVPIVKVTGHIANSPMPVTVLWFNQPYLYNKYANIKGKTVLVAGSVVFKPAQYREPDHYEITAPSVFDPEGMGALGIYPTYKKVAGMAEDYLQACIDKAFQLTTPPAESIPQHIVTDNNLMGHADMISELHYPRSEQTLEAALIRRRWDDLLYFALRVELGYRGSAIGSPFNLPMVRTMNALRGSLPFQLTPDQAYALDNMLGWIRTGRRINALVQGDVGCGKTIIAILLMTAFAENGYQAALMAPTQILAQQHYEELCQRVKPYGINVAFVSGQKLRKAEQKALEEGIATGKYQLIVGTQALLSDTYKFKNLALAIVDEEHKYGVMQRKALTEKAAQGTHTVTMSATPIPRTLAQTIYGDNVQLYSIKTKPNGRLPVRTGHFQDMNRVLNIVYSEVKKRGHQAYVVCPMIAPNEKVEGVDTAEETYEKYRRALEPYGITVGLVTGKTKKQDAAQILADFKENRLSVLISTTVIEVGVNVPNATCIVIHSAERFGLAQLHQLRGRVGRGSDQAYCILVSQNTQNPRLATMCAHTDGFKIAEMDLTLRGAGDFLGSQQSGTEKYLALALQYNKEYAQAQKAARWILDNGADCALLDKAIQDHNDNVEGEMVC